MSIVMHVMGGTGNQIFQYAAGQAAALRCHTDLKLRVAGYDSDWRVYSLSLFSGITAPTCRDYEGEIIQEGQMPYDVTLVNRTRNGCSLYGYFQTEKYFSETRDLLLQQILPKQPLTFIALETEQLIRAEGPKSAFLTVRRTDYVNTPYHGVLPTEYYTAATKMIADKVDDPCFFIFSDEPDWVRENFRLPYRSVVAGTFDRSVKPHLGREDSDLYLMSLCHHAVMANSSFSWWGAWLHQGNDRIVIAPQRWFLEGRDDTRDLIPDRWLRI